MSHRSFILHIFTKFDILIIIRSIAISQFIRGISSLDQRISRLFSYTIINLLTGSFSRKKNRTLDLSLNLLLRKSTLRLKIS